MGYLFKYNLDDNSAFYNNFNSVRSSFFSLSTFGLNPNGLNPFLQAYIYKTFCLSKFLYGIEIMSLNKATVTKININQNIMIKSMLGISKYCHTSELLRVLNLYDINCLIVFLKLSFIRNLKNNILTYKIFSF